MPELVSEQFDWLGKAPEEYKFYDGAISIFYDDDEHSYIRYDLEGNTVLVPGVTSAVHVIDKSAALTQWAANMACDCVREEAEMYLLNTGGDWRDFTTLELEKWLGNAKYHHRNYKEKASDTGHLAHAWIEQFIKSAIAGQYDRMFALIGDLPEEERARNGCLASLDWMAKHRVRWVQTERKVYSKLFDYAGTMDGLAYVSACGDKDCCGVIEGLVKVAATFVDVLAVVDWKTSNALYPEYDYQTAAYLMATNEELSLGIELRFVARLGKDDAQFESRFLPPNRIQEDFEIYLGCLTLYRALERRKAADKEHKEAVKAAEKAAKEAAEIAYRERRAEYKAKVKAARDASKATYKLLRAEKVAVIDAEARCEQMLEDALRQVAIEYPEFVKDTPEVEEKAAA